MSRIGVLGGMGPSATVDFMEKIIQLTPATRDQEHLPVIASFWETILLGHQTYAGGAFRVHADLHRQVPLRAGHFERWLLLWRTTVDELFVGERAELAKAHALRVARAFHRRLPEPAADSPAAPAGGLAITHHGSSS